MKHLYTALALASIVASGASATTAVMTVKTDNVEFSVRQPESVKVSEKVSARTAGHSVVKMADGVKLSNASSMKQIKTVVNRAPDTQDWSSIGTGVWREGIFTLYSDVEAGQTWNVDVEQCASQPGWYRILPYVEGTPLATLMGVPDNDNYIYINATDPKKVYCEDWLPFNGWLVSQAVVENEWDGSTYGTLTDGVISFPDDCFGLTNNQIGQWVWTGADFKIALPGAVMKDYSLKVKTDHWCEPDNKMTVDIIAGDDVAKVMLAILPGDYDIEGNEEAVMEFGEEFVGNMSVVYTAEDHGMHSVLAVAVDAEGNMVGTGAMTQFLGLFDNDDEWETLGNAVYTEGVYVSAYNNIDAENLTVEMQQHKTETGRYRLVNPYAVHSLAEEVSFATHAGHSHHLYINAVNPAHVYIEPSATGLDLGYGDGAVSSYGAMFAGTEYEDLAAEMLGCYGTVEGNVITIPDGVLMIGEKDYENGAFMDCGAGFKVVMPAYSGLGETLVSADSNAAVEYFNLQGVKVATPQAGQLVIKRQGDTVIKTVIR